MVLEALELLNTIGSMGEQARRAGIPESTWRRWARKDIRLPLRKPRVALEHFLGLDQLPPADQRAELERLRAKWATEVLSIRAAMNGTGALNGSGKSPAGQRRK